MKVNSDWMQQGSDHIWPYMVQIGHIGAKYEQKDRCTLGTDCGWCHYPHEKPWRKGKKARERQKAMVDALLAELRARGIGQLATIGPKQMLLILPAGAHGVFVHANRNHSHLEGSAGANFRTQWQ